MSYETHQTLIRRCQDQQDEQSWDEFVRYYQTYIYQFLKSMGLNHHDAEDLKQAVLIKAWKKLQGKHRDQAENSHILLITQTDKNGKLTYYAGYGWEKAGEITNQAQDPEPGGIVLQRETRGAFQQADSLI